MSTLHAARVAARVALSNNVCTSPGENGDPSRAVPVGDPGQGACNRTIHQPIPQVTGKPISFECFSLGVDDPRFRDVCCVGRGLDAPDGLLMGGLRALNLGRHGFILTGVSGYRE